MDSQGRMFPNIDVLGKQAVIVVLAGIAVCASLFVVLNTLHVVFLAYREIPYWDQWRTVSELKQVDEQGLTWRLLFSPHNEHRIVITRLSFLLDREFFQGRGVFPYWTVIFLQALNAALIVRLYLSALQLPDYVQRAQRFPSLAAVTANAALVFGLMFSLVQQESLAWSFQVGFVGVYAFSTMAFWCYAKAISTKASGPSCAWFVGSLAAFLAATFSLSNGILCGLILLIIGLFGKAPRWMQFTIMLLTTSLAIFYFHSNRDPYSGIQINLSFQEPLSYLHYVAAFLGNPVRRLGLGYATALGSLGLASTAIITWKILDIRQQNIGQLTLFAIMLFVLLTAVVTAFGRISHGVTQALDSRYATPGCIFWAAQILYWSSQAIEHRSYWLMPAALSASLFLLLAVLTGEAASEKSLGQRTRMFDLVTNALLSNVFDPKILGRICWDPNLVTSGAKYLRENRLSIFSSADATWLGQKLTQIALLAETDRCIGSLDRVESIKNRSGNVSVSGWAYDREATVPVRRVVLVDSDDRVSGYASGGYRRSDIPAKRMRLSSKKVGWMGFAQGNRGEVLRAFAILHTGKACKIGEKEIPFR